MNKRTIVGALAVFMFLLIAAQTVTAQQKEVLSTTTTENADGSTTTTTKYADGSTTTTTKYADGSTTTTTKKTLGTITVEKGKFPDGFIGTWERDNFINTLTFTTNTIKSSSQNYSWNLNVVSGDSYTWYPDENPLLKQTVTIKLVNGNLVISGDSGTGDNNWNGTWKKIK
jgi:hypothetical protein